jgi:phenylalanyl-tRNA synthetase alpha chain
MKLNELEKDLGAILEKIDAGLPSLQTDADVQSFVSSLTGKKGQLTALIKELRGIPEEERPEAGRLINKVKQAVADKAGARLEKIRKQKIEKVVAGGEAVDITLPGFPAAAGRLHPLRKTLDEIVYIFTCLGFDIAEGPEIETDWHNFEALGFPPDHPARQMQATFFIRSAQKLVLRTHTSPVQIRRLLKSPPPVKIIAPGVVYRHDDDPSHSPMFIQVEGLLVDDHTTFADLKGTLELFLHEMFGRDVPIRLRPSFFPFTEPSGEVDIACPVCGRSGRRDCSICKGSGWTEILGCGQVDPVVFENVGLDPEKVQGYAFGLGVDRIAMFKYGIDSIQHFYRNDPRFLRQF